MTDAYETEPAAVSPGGTVDGAAAVFWVAGVDILVPVLVAATLFAKAARLRRRAQAALVVERGSDDAPREGAEVVRGIVESEEPAVVVTVTQTGTEKYSDKSWATTWTEVRREVSATPFVLRMRGGIRLRCEPGATPRLLDELDVVERRGPDRRIRRARLTNGETAIVRGRIVAAVGPGGGGGYREPARELVMRPADDGMEISTRGLEAPLQEAARLRRKAGMWISGLTVVAALGACPFLLSLVVGHVEPARVLRLEDHSRASRWGRRHGSVFIQHVVFELADGTSGNEELAHDDNGRVREGQRILVRVSPLKTELGTRATTSAIRLVITTAVLLVAHLLCSMILRSARPWWEREEVVDVYRGRLANDFDETT